METDDCYKWLPMKLIFLDIDGVLNNYEWFGRMYAGNVDPYLVRREILDRVSVGVLNHIIKQTGAKVVISSSWRFGRTVEDMRAILGKNGFVGEVVGMTTTDPEAVHRVLDSWGERIQRGHEIQAWMGVQAMKGMKIDSYVVIDDDGDMAGVEDHLVQLKHDTGLQMEHVPEIIRILNK